MEDVPIKCHQQRNNMLFLVLQRGDVVGKVASSVVARKSLNQPDDPPNIATAPDHRASSSHVVGLSAEPFDKPTPHFV
jgi:hypothetical protein